MRTQRVAHQVSLEYVDADPMYAAPGAVMRSVKDPEHSDELRLTIYDDSPNARSTGSRSGRRQLELAGSARALECFGTFLIALARLDGSDDGHVHLEIEGPAGSPSELIVRRLTEPA